MANNQIEKYRLAFEKMSKPQQKAFIENLRKQIQGKNLPAYNKFLAECVQKYNANNSMNNLLDDMKPTKANNNTFSIMSLKIWIFVSIAASVLFQFIMPFAAEYGTWKRTNIFGYTERHSNSYLGYKTYMKLLDTFTTTTLLEVCSYAALAISVVLAVLLISSNWNTKKVLRCIAVSQVYTIGMFFLTWLNFSYYEIVDTTYQLDTLFIFTLLPTALAAVLSFMGYKKI